MDSSNLPSPYPFVNTYADRARLSHAVDVLRRFGELDLMAYDEVYLAIDTDRDRYFSGQRPPKPFSWHGRDPISN